MLAALGVILATRTTLGEDAFAAWGWRVPFLASAILLGVSVWLRSKLAESPAFVALRDKGAVSKAPLREAFGARKSLGQVAIAFFSMMCAQGAVWYSTFFYIQVFLEKMLGIAGATVNLIVMAMTLVSAPLYVLFGWLSDRWGRKPVMLAGMLVALVAYFPGYHAIARAANPALIAAQEATPVTVVTNPATCSVQFDPTGTRHFSSACDIAKSLLAGSGISYRDVGARDGRTAIAVGRALVPVADGSTLDAKGIKELKSATGTRLKAALSAAGYPAKADARRIDWFTLMAWLMLFTAAACALYGPMAAALVEMFPTRVRYTAMSLPYHVGTGWVGGFLPVTSFAIVAITGDLYAGLWYAVAFTAISVLATILFLKETSGKPLT